jgi:signal transduction histidine kinase
MPSDIVAGDADAFVTADRTRLERAFANLVDNADAYGGGVVAVELVRDGDEVRVLVDDAGPGIPLADRERVFARFATSGGARGSARGTGLGLAIVRETATSLGGEVWCTDRPGGGARFVLRLPATGAPGTPESDTQQEPHAQSVEAAT